MIIIVGGTKGGSGKSMIGLNLLILRAATGKKRELLLIDTDKQGTATDFSLQRQQTLGTTGYTSIQLKGDAVREEIRKLADKFDDIFVDVGGRDTIEQRGALGIADVYLVPFCPASFDVWPLEQVEEILEDALQFNPKLKAFSFLNKADSRGKDNAEAIELAQESKYLKYLPTPIGQRKIFRSASSSGLGIFEYKTRDRKAEAELKSLYYQIFEPKTNVGRTLATLRTKNSKILA